MGIYYIYFYQTIKINNNSEDFEFNNNYVVFANQN